MVPPVVEKKTAKICSWTKNPETNYQKKMKQQESDKITAYKISHSKIKKKYPQIKYLSSKYL